jgi:hypothetical protein
MELTIIIESKAVQSQGRAMPPDFGFSDPYWFER